MTILLLTKLADVHPELLFYLSLRVHVEAREAFRMLLPAAMRFVRLQRGLARRRLLTLPPAPGC